jgi:SNF2 family DNA or RNA helicase
LLIALQVNNLDDVFSHLRFLSISPSASWDHFRAHISSAQKRKPKVATKRVQVLFQSHHEYEARSDTDLLQAILKTCSLRRHKESLLNGKRLLELPPKTTEIDELDFTEEERATYVAIETRAKIKFNSFLKKGSVMKNMACVLTLLLRLRQLTCESSTMCAISSG